MIRFARPKPEEAEALARVHVRCWQEAYDGILPADYLISLSFEQRLKQWEEAIGNTDIFNLAAYDGKAVAGFVCSGAARDGARYGADGEILAIYVLRQYQGLGVGKRLMAEAARDWLARGGRTLAVLFIAANARAEGFYRSLGGEVVGESSFEIAGLAVPDKAMVFSDLPALATRGKS